MKTVDFSETIAASDLKVGRCRQLIEFMKLCGYRRSRSFLYHKFFQILFVLFFTRPRYQVSVYRTIGPLVYFLFYRFFSQQVSVRGRIKNKNKIHLDHFPIELKSKETQLCFLRF